MSKMATQQVSRVQEDKTQASRNDFVYCLKKPKNSKQVIIKCVGIIKYQTNAQILNQLIQPGL